MEVPHGTPGPVLSEGRESATAPPAAFIPPAAAFAGVSDVDSEAGEQSSVVAERGSEVSELPEDTDVASVSSGSLAGGIHRKAGKGPKGLRGGLTGLPPRRNGPTPNPTAKSFEGSTSELPPPGSLDANLDMSVDLDIDPEDYGDMSEWTTDDEGDSGNVGKEGEASMSGQKAEPLDLSGMSYWERGYVVLCDQFDQGVLVVSGVVIGACLVSWAVLALRARAR